MSSNYKSTYSKINELRKEKHSKYVNEIPFSDFKLGPGWPTEKNGYFLFKKNYLNFQILDPPNIFFREPP